MRNLRLASLGRNIPERFGRYHPVRSTWPSNENSSLETCAVNIEQLIFVGLNGYALALNRETGEIVWSNDQMKSGYVTLLLDGDRLIASTNGYIYSLNPLTGEIQWNNPLKGFGMGAPTSLVSVRGQISDVVLQQAAAAIAAAASAS